MAILSNLDPLSIYFNAPTICRFGENSKINEEVSDPVVWIPDSAILQRRRYAILQRRRYANEAACTKLEKLQSIGTNG